MNVVLCSFQFQSNGFEEGFWSGAWTGAFQLVTLAVVALFVNVLYQRYRQLATARQELINEIDQFTIRLYKPRKAYQRIIEGTGDLLTRIPDLERREAWRIRQVEKLFEEYLQAVGRFRALQVKIMPLFGNHLELFAHYLAI